MRALESIAKGLMLTLALTGAPVHASMVYHWQTIDNSDTLVPQSGRLEITDAAWEAGSLSVNQGGTYNDGEPAFTFPDSPLISMSFTANGKTIAIDPVTGESSFPSDWFLEADLGLSSGGDYLTGFLLANNSESNFDMGSNGQIWNISLFASDDLAAGCSDAPYCSGATGVWRLASATTAPVPAPPAGLLFTAGAGLMLLYRARRTATHR